MRERLTTLGEVIAGALVIAGAAVQFGVGVGLMVAGMAVGFVSWLVGE